MPLKVLEEEYWKAAARDGGTFEDLREAFYWDSADEWQCPFVDKDDRNQEDDLNNYNGWYSYYCINLSANPDITGGTLEEKNRMMARGKKTLLPKEAIEYIATMYVYWKMVDDTMVDGKAG